MIRSMTGYGKASAENEQKLVTAEIRTLNSKQLDLSIRVPYIFREKELELRNMIQRTLNRGKVELSVTMEAKDGLSPKSINKEQVKAYFNQLVEIQDELQVLTKNLLHTVMRLPEVLSAEQELLTEQDAKILLESVTKAIESVNGFREQEGRALEEDLRLRIKNISDNLLAIERFEDNRIERIRERIRKNIEEFANNQKLDENRFEQEIIYYLEKLDITEEKVRLAQHCKYFVETMESDELSGKKLNFISQEIGREINTIGSKANDADMQKYVVMMKDDLEKIKEQTLNIL